MTEIISIFASLIFLFLFSNFPFNIFVIKKFYFSTISFSDSLLINIIINCNLLLLLSFFKINLSLIFFSIVIPSLIIIALFYRNYLKLLKNNVYLVTFFLLIFYLISIILIKNAYLEWDGLAHWIIKSSIFFQGGSYQNLIGVPFDYYPHLGTYLWAFFWKHSVLQIEYSGRLFFIFIFLVTIFALNFKIANSYSSLEKILIIFTLTFLSTNLFLFGGYQEYFIFFIFFCFSNFFIKYFLYRKEININFYPELLLISITNIMLWIKQEGFFYYIILNIIFVIHAKRNILNKIFYIIIVAFLVIVFLYIKNLYFGSLKFNAGIINEETFKIFDLKYLFSKILIITKYFFITFFKYPIWILIILSIIILYKNSNYFSNKRFILTYIFLIFSFIYAVFLNEPTNLSYLVPLTLNRILFATSGFLIFLNVDLFNLIKTNSK